MKILSNNSLRTEPVWLDVVDALRQGHLYPKPQIDDVFQKSGPVTMVARSAFIEGFGCGTKTFTVGLENSSKDLPTVQGGMIFFEPNDGTPLALVDSALITNWKTAADSVLGATLLAKDQPQTLLIVGAGTVAESLAKAYSSAFRSLEKIVIHNRTKERGIQLVDTLCDMGLPVEFELDLEHACAKADIISTATMACEPVIKGDWVKPGTHVDLIGAYKADMREADDVLLRKGRIFVDSFDTTIDHIGELKIPLLEGTLERSDILGDLYDLVAAKPNDNKGRSSGDEITIFKNGGGAHLDLMTARYLIDLDNSAF